MKAVRIAAALFVLPLATLSASAQVVDEQTEDHEEQDRRYYERYLREEEERQKRPDSPDPDAFLAKAEELVRDKNYWSRSSDHYRIQTNDPRLDSKAAVDLLESFRVFFDRFWASRVELHPYEEVSRFFLYDSFYLYNQLLQADFRFSLLRPKGHYISAFNVVALHTTAGQPRDLADSMVHEAAHQLVDQRLFSAAGSTPLWLSEGLASYFGYTYRDPSGSFQEGVIGGKSTRLIKEAPRGGPRESSARLKDFRQTLKSFPYAETPLVDWLIRTRSPDVFYGEDVDTRYTASWVLVHFLFHADGGRHAQAFTRYLRLEAQGRGGPEVFYEEVGMSPEALDAALREYVKRLRVK